MGSQPFSEGDLKIREKVIRFKYPETDRARLGAYSQLIQGYLIVEVLARMGHPITVQDQSAEVARIDRDTRDPEGLKQLKSLCGGDVEAYWRIAILPDFANRKYHFDIYPNEEKIHQDLQAEAERALAQLRAGRAPNRETRQVLFSSQSGFEAVPTGPKPPAPAIPGQDPAWDRYEKELFQPAPQGEWVNRVIAFPEAFALMRWTGWKAKGVRRVEQIWFPKRDASEYLWEQASRVPVWIKDAAMKDELKRTVSWTARISWD